MPATLVPLILHSNRVSSPRHNGQKNCDFFAFVHAAQHGTGEVAKLNTVNHSGLMQAWNEASLKRGQTIYNNLCVN